MSFKSFKNKAKSKGGQKGFAVAFKNAAKGKAPTGKAPAGKGNPFAEQGDEEMPQGKPGKKFKLKLNK